MANVLRSPRPAWVSQRQRENRRWEGALIFDMHDSLTRPVPMSQSDELLGFASCPRFELFYKPDGTVDLLDVEEYEDAVGLQFMTVFQKLSPELGLSVHWVVHGNFTYLGLAVIGCRRTCSRLQFIWQEANPFESQARGTGRICPK